jgi:hypothetical protein
MAQLLGTLRSERGKEATRVGTHVISGSVRTQHTNISFHLNADGSGSVVVRQDGMLRFSADIPLEHGANNETHAHAQSNAERA